MTCSNCHHLCMLSPDSEQWACDLNGKPEATYMNDTCPSWLKYVNNDKFKGRTMHGMDMVRAE